MSGAQSKPIKVIDFNNLSTALKVTTSINSGFILKYRIVFKSNSR
jgi:hypothetical protein